MTVSVRDYVDSHFLHKTSTGIINIPYLDGVRGVAILMVIMCHFFAYSSSSLRGFPVLFSLAGTQYNAWEFIMSGANGVRLFFVLSAFLLFMPYARYYLYGGSKVSGSRFFKRRAARIIPAYYMAMAVYSAAVFAFGLNMYFTPFTAPNFILNALFLQPFFLFLGGITPDFMPGTWSLVTEVHFYLLLPLIAPLFSNIKKATLMAVLLVLFSYAYRAAVTALVHNPGRAFALGHNIVAHIDLFGIGMLASVIYLKHQAGEIKVRPWIAYLLLAISPILYLDSMSFINIGHLDYELIVEMSFFIFILGVILSDSFVRRFMEWTPLRFIGLVSYSMFLLNLTFAWYVLTPILDTLSITIPLHRFAFNMTFGLVLFITLCAFSYQYIEKPFLSGRKREKIDPALLSEEVL